MRYLILLAIINLNLSINAQNITGQWETYDDATNEKKAIVEFYKDDALFFAKIVKSFVGKENAICEECKGTKKNHAIHGLVIIENLRKNKKDYVDGTILDPESGEVYSCQIKLLDNNTLKVRGFVGLSLFGRTQYWRRKL